MHAIDLGPASGSADEAPAPSARTEPRQRRADRARVVGPGRGQLIRDELLANSLHFPLANLLFEYFFDHGQALFLRPETFALLLGALVQAVILGHLRDRGLPWLLPGNLVGPVVYVGFETLVEGSQALHALNHQAYFAFAFAIGLLQQLQHRTPAVERPLLVLETLVRSSFILAIYIIIKSPAGIESPAGAGPVDLLHFLDEPANRFIATALLFLGLVLGLATVSSRQHYRHLQRTASRLHEISSWSWGRGLVGSVIEDPTLLRRRQVERFILFLDIRGFTAWCDRHSPEQVCDLLNRSFDALESVWRDHPVIRSKLTGDELMLVLDRQCEALQLAEALRARADRVLAPHGLGAGIGLHFGPVIEGLIGTTTTRAYDVLGDTVNVAARLCSAARAGECLISDAACGHSRRNTDLPLRRVLAKGKRQPIDARVSAAA